MFSKNIRMEDNDFLDNWGSSSYGLLLKDITDSEITNNRFQKNTIGIYGEGALRITITGNGTGAVCTMASVHITVLDGSPGKEGGP